MPEMTNLGHIDRALTNISTAYMQGADAFIADKVFPIINVNKQSDVYFEYSKADMFRNEVQERGRGAESAGGNWNVKVADPYYCRKYAYHYDITQEEKVNYDKPLDIDRDTTEGLSQKMLLKRECDFSASFFKKGVWGKDVTADGTTIKKWTDQTSDPIKMVNDAMLEMAENTGMKPNFAIMSPDVFYALKNHEAIMDRIKYTQKGIVTADLLATLFEVENVYVAWSVVNSAAKGADAAVDFIMGKHALLCYSNPRPALRKPSAGYTFAWTGLEGAGAYGNRIVRLPMDLLGLGTERIEGEMAFDQKVICKDLGVFFKDIV